MVVLLRFGQWATVWRALLGHTSSEAMNAVDQIQALFSAQTASKRLDMEQIHKLIVEGNPEIQLRYLDGRDGTGKVVTNPNIGYGSCQIKYKDGSSREFYRVGMSASSTGISIYFMGLEDKNLLATTYGETIGKAKVTGYCISFKSLKDIVPEVLTTAIRSHLSA